MSILFARKSVNAKSCVDDTSRVYFRFTGDIIETDDPCMHCECGLGGELRCSTMACTPCQGQHVPVEGSCCGECRENVTQPIVEGCERGGQMFDEGTQQG